MKKILIANRGEIAVRVIRACRDMGLGAVAVYSECDRTALHVRMADEAWPVGPSAPRESYLRIDRILDAAKQSGADAIHPGYGFLAENEDFAAACRDAGLTFIGPTAEAITLMGSKTAARQVAMRAGAPVVPGTENPLGEDVAHEEVQRLAASIGYPVMLKAVAGGGGKGMRLVTAPGDLASALRAARSEALSAFGDGAVYLERRLLRPRHIEVQLLADQHGTVIPFVERECSIQRRHQKVVEESPSPVVTPELRRRLTSAAASIARAASYTNAGTIEFLLDQDGSFYFLEMNTRLQVEHPITEMVTGVDLVQWQIRIARGEKLTLDAEAMLVPRAHAIECRIYAEDPASGFLPSPGRIQGLQVPQGPGVRDDSGAYEGGDVPIFYDPMISKLITWADDRPRAIARMKRALSEYEVRGIRTTIPFFQWLLDREDFRQAEFDTTFIDRVFNGHSLETAVDGDHVDLAVIAAAVHQFTKGSCSRGVTSGREQPLEGRGPVRGLALMTFEVEVGEKLRVISIKRAGASFRIDLDGRLVLVDARRVGDLALSMLIGGDNGHVPTRSVDVALAAGDQPGAFDVHVGSQIVPLTIRPAGTFSRHKRQPGAASGNGPQRVTAPMPGKIVRVLVKPGDTVAARQGLVVIEAMKMENELRASRPGRVRDVSVSEGQSVDAGAMLLVVE